MRSRKRQNNVSNNDCNRVLKCQVIGWWLQSVQPVKSELGDWYLGVDQWTSSMMFFEYISFIKYFHRQSQYHTQISNLLVNHQSKQKEMYNWENITFLSISMHFDDRHLREHWMCLCIHDRILASLPISTDMLSVTCPLIHNLVGTSE